jgi:hypothetical protein
VVAVWQGKAMAAAGNCETASRQEEEDEMSWEFTTKGMRRSRAVVGGLIARRWSLAWRSCLVGRASCASHRAENSHTP